MTEPTTVTDVATGKCLEMAELVVRERMGKPDWIRVEKR